MEELQKKYSFNNNLTNLNKSYEQNNSVSSNSNLHSLAPVLYFLPPSDPRSENSFRNYSFTGASHSQEFKRRTSKKKTSNELAQISIDMNEKKEHETVDSTLDKEVNPAQLNETNLSGEHPALKVTEQDQTDNEDDEETNYEDDDQSSFQKLHPFEKERIKNQLRSPLQRFQSTFLSVLSLLWNTSEDYMLQFIELDLYFNTFEFEFGLGFWNIIDFLSIVPFYLDLMIPILTIAYLNTLRLLRILRIFQFAKNSVGFNITTRVFQRSITQIAMMSIWVFAVIITSSTLIYYTERGNLNHNDFIWYRTGADGQIEPSPYQSIIHSFWWSIVTITTTGYGDAVPVTGWGKFIAGITMLCGIMLIAIPTSIIGSNYVNEWALYRRIEFQMRLRKTREKANKASEFSGSKTKQIEILRSHNQTMLEALAEIQEKLADVNPPRYWQKYKTLQMDYEKALIQISQLESDVLKWKRIAENLDCFNKKIFPGSKNHHDGTLGAGKCEHETSGDGNDGLHRTGKVWDKFRPTNHQRHHTILEKRDSRSYSDQEIETQEKNKSINSKSTRVISQLRKKLTLHNRDKFHAERSHSIDKEKVGSIDLYSHSNPINPDESSNNDNTERTHNKMLSGNLSDPEYNLQSVMTFPKKVKKLEPETGNFSARQNMNAKSKSSNMLFDLFKNGKEVAQNTNLDKFDLNTGSGAGTSTDIAIATPAQHQIEVIVDNPGVKATPENEEQSEQNKPIYVSASPIDEKNLHDFNSENSK
ncbi:8456_t:CDS:2 [Ambispora leptoticha]|uniref:8456_t:CDS:1 n=1 Tax=Ambispora leptoticha TaxID=144679 RepID=A0A9N9FCW7_9GLOM|nr:8456_t:CDS:2 [Ambispora leptoticha]